MIRTPLTRWFDLTRPVVGAPMAGVSPAASWRGPCRAAGGLGMIGVSGSAPRPSSSTEQCAIPADAGLPFGVGLMVWTLADRPDLFEATIAARPGLVSVSFGDPAPYVGPLHDAGIAVAGAGEHRRRRRPARSTPASTCSSRRAPRPAGTPAARDPAAAAGGADAHRPAGARRRRDRHRRRHGGRARGRRGRRLDRDAAAGLPEGLNGAGRPRAGARSRPATRRC